MKITFIDTCILCEILEADGKSTPEEAKYYKAEFQERSQRGEHFIIPTAVIIELGNHIAHIKHDENRKQCTRKFRQLLQASLHENPPWRLYPQGMSKEWSKEWLNFLEGNIEHIIGNMKIGTGDLTIYHQYQMFCESECATDEVQIWSKDSDMCDLINYYSKRQARKAKLSRRRDQ